MSWWPFVRRSVHEEQLSRRYYDGRLDILRGLKPGAQILWNKGLIIVEEITEGFGLANFKPEGGWMIRDGNRTYTYVPRFHRSSEGDTL